MSSRFVDREVGVPEGVEKFELPLIHLGAVSNLRLVRTQIDSQKVARSLDLRNHLHGIQAENEDVVFGGGQKVAHVNLQFGYFGKERDLQDGSPFLGIVDHQFPLPLILLLLLLEGLLQALDYCARVFDYQGIQFLQVLRFIFLKVFAFFNIFFCVAKRRTFLIFSDDRFEYLGRSHLRNLWSIFYFTKTLHFGVFVSKVRTFLKRARVYCTIRHLLVIREI